MVFKTHNAVGLGRGLSIGPGVNFRRRISRFLPETLAAIEQAADLGGSVSDPAKLDVIIREIVRRGLWPNLRCLVGRGLGEELRPHEGTDFVVTAFDASPLAGHYSQASEAAQPIIVNDRWLTFESGRLLTGNSAARSAFTGIDQWTILCVAPVPPTQTAPAFLFTAGDSDSFFTLTGKTTTTGSPAFQNHTWVRRLGTDAYNQQNHDTADEEIIRAQFVDFRTDSLEHSVYAAKTEQGTGTTNLTSGVTGTTVGVAWGGASSGAPRSYNRSAALFMVFNRRIPQADYNALVDLLTPLYSPLP